MHQFFLFCKQVRPHIPFREDVINNIVCTSLWVSSYQSMVVQDEEAMKSQNFLFSVLQTIQLLEMETVFSI